MYTLATGEAPFIHAQEAITRADTKEEKKQTVEEFRQSVEELRTSLLSEESLDPNLAKIIAGLLTWDPSQRTTDAQLCKQLGLPR